MKGIVNVGLLVRYRSPYCLNFHMRFIAFPSWLLSSITLTGNEGEGRGEVRYWAFTCFYSIRHRHIEICDITLPVIQLPITKHTAALTILCITAPNNDTQYEGCPGSVRKFWISPEPDAWPRYNLAFRQRRPYYASLNIHTHVGLVSRQWDAIDWACVLCDHRIHKPLFQRLC
jgi:hypothetical protein